ncbi:PspC domain-containing protein [Fontimonas thermophila]|nr:PspC domain-containing protein [Fontimonas thermophila]
MTVRNRLRDEISLFRRMRRLPAQGWIAGVCAGLSEFFDWNVKLIRLLFAAGFILGGFFPVGVIYLALWYLMEPGDGPASARTPDTPDITTLKLRFSRLEQRLRHMEDCVASRDFELRRELRKLEG